MGEGDTLSSLFSPKRGVESQVWVWSPAGEGPLVMTKFHCLQRLPWDPGDSS